MSEEPDQLAQLAQLAQFEEREYIVICPNCTGVIWVEEINCAIFRHGTLKTNGKQIDPHATEDLCTWLRINNLINGCGKPLRVIQNCETGRLRAEVCGYE